MIGGPAAFVVTANSFEAYKEAMTGTLVREISGGEIAWEVPRKQALTNSFAGLRGGP